MENIIVEKFMPEGNVEYEFKYYKTVKSKDGIDVEVESHVERYTIKQLEDMKSALQIQLNTIQDKLDKINELEG